MIRLAALLLLAATPPAAALDACFEDSVGAWRGPVYDAGQILSMTSEFHLQADGTLAGSYRVLGDEPYDGRLTAFQPTGTCEADFIWTDRFGSGAVHLHFEPERGRFRGFWGNSVPVEGQIFEGDRAVEVPSS